jgi:small subunit ribosomal protein S7
MRRAIKRRKPAEAEYKYNSVKLAQFINYTMHDGKKEVARAAVYGMLDDIKEMLKVENPLEVFEQAIKNVGPTTEVRSRRIGGATYQVPREVRPERKQALAYRWILDAARSKKGAPIRKRLADEIVAASKNEGEAVKKRENTQKMADANRAFAHFAW